MTDPNFCRGNYLGFPTKDTLRKHISWNILQKYPINSSLKGADLSLLMDLLERHPRFMEKIGCGVRTITVGKGPRENTRGFRIIRTDGEDLDFSFYKCLYPQKPDAAAIKGFRHAIRGQQRSFKLNAFLREGGTSATLKCPVSGDLVMWENGHVDHIPPDTFKNLLARYASERQIKLEDIITSKDEKTGMIDVIADQNLAEDFALFHQEHAKLRLVSARANFSEIRKEATRLDSRRKGTL